MAKTKFLAAAAALALTGGSWLGAQQGDEGVTGAPSESEESRTAMIEHCKQMCAVNPNPGSPESLLAWKQELGLTEDQVTNLRTIEVKATSDAKALLSADQVDKLRTLAGNGKPESMMQCMMHGGKDGKENAMSMPCPPMHEQGGISNP